MTDPKRPITRPQPPQPHQGSSSGFGGTLGTIALAIGVGVLGFYMLDAHAHTCEACGTKWRHLGAFNLGDPLAHTCSSCGTIQWFKDGVPHVFRQSILPPSKAALAAKLQEIRDVPRLGLPSGLSMIPAAKENKT